MSLAMFGITDDSLSLAVNLVILVLVVLWLALAYWTFADARRRIGDPILVTTATVLGLIPFLGPLVYTVLRPPEFLEDVREREIETQASELRMRHLTAQSCPRCEHPIERSWLRCPECQHRLKDPCVSCSRPVDPRWSICPYCETQLRRPAEREEGERRPPRRSADPERKRSGAKASSPSPSSSPTSESSSRRRAEKPESDAEGSTRSERQPRSAAAKSEGDNAEAGSSRPPRRRSTSKS